jgi:uncharacterized membrane protein
MEKKNQSEESERLLKSFEVFKDSDVENHAKSNTILPTKAKSVKSEIEDDDEEKSGTTLAVAFCLMLIFSLANRIFGRLQTYPMHNYPLFLNFLSVWIYIPICYMYIIPVLLFSKSITKEQREIPKYKFAVMGGYDSLAGIMQTFAVNYISNASMIVLVQQSAIPISMLISKYTLNSSYSKMQYIGASIVLLGIVVVLIPNFLLPPAASSSGSLPGTETSPTVQLIWLFVLVVSCVPMCLSSVYKEKALGEVDIDIIYLNGWVAIFQFLIAIPLCLPSAQIQNIPVSDIIPNMYNGFKCWMGVNSITVDNNPYNLPLDDCSSAPLFVNTYLFFNVIYNFLIVVILKLGSANILYMASTVIVPLSNVVFSLKFIPGNQPLRTWDIIGLFVIMIGLVIYRFNKELLHFLQNYVVSSDFKLIDDTTLELEKQQEIKSNKKFLKDIERKQLKYLGLNQMETLQTLVDVRLSKEKTRLLFRSPQQIRGHFYDKIGVQPSPLISRSGPNNRREINEEGLSSIRANYNSTGMSPPIYKTTLEKTSSFRSTPKSSTSTATSSYLTKNPFTNPQSLNGNLSNSNTIAYGSKTSSAGKSVTSSLPKAKKNST